MFEAPTHVIPSMSQAYRFFMDLVVRKADSTLPQAPQDTPAQAESDVKVSDVPVEVCTLSYHLRLPLGLCLSDRLASRVCTK
jgi:hypothetical protein